MNKIKILIADDNLLIAQKLCDKLNEYEDFELIMAKDGMEAIERINNEQPDVVLLDIIMPKLDGVGVLEYFRDNINKNKPVFIVFSAVSQENYISRVMNLGAIYYILKPFDEDVLATRIRQLYGGYEEKYSKQENQRPIMPKNTKPKNSYDDELMVLATKYMREYGLKAHMTGYNYIRDIIIASFDTYCQAGVMPKGIYRTIANKNNVSVQKVERAIRNCIEGAKDDNDPLKRPTNSQVICELIERIRKNN